jgi:hypothetical protein
MNVAVIDFPVNCFFEKIRPSLKMSKKARFAEALTTPETGELGGVSVAQPDLETGRCDMDKPRSAREL